MCLCKNTQDRSICSHDDLRAAHDCAEEEDLWHLELLCTIPILLKFVDHSKNEDVDATHEEEKKNCAEEAELNDVATILEEFLPLHIKAFGKHNKR